MQGDDALTTWIKRVEEYLEAGQLDVVRRSLADAEAKLGDLPQLAQLRQRLQEVERLAAPDPVADLTQRARQEMDRANYDEALTLLRQALGLRPTDADLQGLLEQTEKAAARHSAAQAKHRAVLDVAAEIGRLIDAQQVHDARARLQEAGIEFGRHNAWIQLQQRLDQLESQQAAHRVHEIEQRVESLFQAGNWRGVLHESELLLRLAPDHARGRQLRLEAQGQIEREESRRHHRSAIEEARQNIDRLISARELQRASQKLQEAVHALGQDPAFEELQQRIHQARSDLQFRKRVEWAERRANEAERLIQEANRLSLQGSFADAIQRLESAQELDPSHPDIPDKLATAYAARDRQQEERQRFEALAAQLHDVQGHLDALRLDTAANLIESIRQEHDAEDRLAPLDERLAKLRAAERASARLRQLGDDGQQTPGETLTLLRDQREVWHAYSWKQAMLFPLRGDGNKIFAAVAALLLLLDGLATLPWVGLLFAALRSLAPWLLLGLAPHLSRATVGGQNYLPTASELLAPKPWAKDTGRMLALSCLLLLPALLWILSRPWHGQLEPAAGPLGWWLVGMLVWPACCLGVVALGAMSTFGDAQTFRLAPHVRTLTQLSSDGLFIAHGAFAAVVVLALLRAVLAPALPWVALPLQAVLEAYALLVIPHLVGSLMRRRGVDWAAIYS